MTRRFFWCVGLLSCVAIGCGDSTANVDAIGNASVAAAPDPAANPSTTPVTPAKPSALTPMQRRLSAVGYDERVKIWSKRFDKPESWVRKHTSPNESAVDAETRLIRARVQKKRR
jgi:hypothetical protein